MKNIKLKRKQQIIDGQIEKASFRADFYSFANK